MAEFFNVLPPDDARALLFKHLTRRTAPEQVSSRFATGRVTAEPVFAPHALPSFRRSTMDGFAVIAADTHGASASLPAFLTVTGEVRMGTEAKVKLATGEAAIVHTGGMIPPSADAVVQIEHTQPVGVSAAARLPYEIEVFKAVAVGQNVLQVGEDVERGSRILPEGHLMRPQDIGGLLALGITEIQVNGKPKVAILATGDEVVPPASRPEPGQIRDINSYTIGAQAEQAGAEAIIVGIAPDDLASLAEAAAVALETSDMLVVTAGSSVSLRDLTVQVIDGLGEPGVLLHGVATRPGKPTIVGVVDGKPLLGLPGNPVSAMVQFTMFGAPAIYRLQGLHQPPQKGIVWARISQNVASESGREDYVPARLAQTDQGLAAVPVFGKSNLIYTLVNADGLLKIPLDRGGLNEGEWVEVQLF